MKDGPTADGSGDKGNQSQSEEEDDDDSALILKRKNKKPRVSARILESDDEDESVPPKVPTQREPLAEAAISNLAPLADDIDIDLAGFGEGGMSQLFDATQVDDAGDGVRRAIHTFFWTLTDGDCHRRMRSQSCATENPSASFQPNWSSHLSKSLKVKRSEMISSSLLLLKMLQWSGRGKWRNLRSDI